MTVAAAIGSYAALSFAACALEKLNRARAAQSGVSA